MNIRSAETPKIKSVNSTNPNQLDLRPDVAGRSARATVEIGAVQKRGRVFVIIAVLLLIAFSGPLWSVMRLALKEDIQSHILLIPFIAFYLWKTQRSPLRLAGGEGQGEGDKHGQREVSILPSLPQSEPAPDSSPPSVIRNPQFIPAPGPPLPRVPLPVSALRMQRSTLPAFLVALVALVFLGAYWGFGKSGRLPPTDALSLATVSFLSLMLATALATLGWPALRSRLFAVAFLVFMVPLPLAFIEFMSIGLQLASAEAAAWMLSLTGMPMFREGLLFHFGTLSVRVAEECSGVRSTFVLFITSLVAAHLFLRTGWKKALLVLAIFPLGVLRNGFRITVISWLTVNVDPSVISSPLHHRGGPIFFVLSLVPLFGLLWILRRSDFPKRS